MDSVVATSAQASIPEPVGSDQIHFAWSAGTGAVALAIPGEEERDHTEGRGGRGPEGAWSGTRLAWWASVASIRGVAASDDGHSATAPYSELNLKSCR